MQAVRKMIGLALLAGAATVGATGAAHAEGEFSGNVALTTNYVWRGVTQSAGDPAIQGGIDYTASNFYIGTWGSSVDPASTGVADGELELDVYAGFTPTIGPVTLDIGVLGYFYPGASADGDWAEAYIGASFSPVEPLTLGATASFSDDVYNSGEESTYLEGNVAYTFSETVALSAAYANFDLGALGDYNTWNVGATLSYGGFGFDFRYIDTDITGADSEFVFTLSRAL
ncbi:MAG: TorF family putative porin [Hyphomonadaceae bacterium]|nr:TorF family putative porin [Hyphomonadaceae bacterium]